MPLRRVAGLERRDPLIRDPLRGRRALPIRDGAGRVPVRAAYERVDARRGEGRDPPADTGRSQVKVHAVFPQSLRQVPRRRGVGQRVEQGAVGRIRISAGGCRRGAVGCDHPPCGAGGIRTLVDGGTEEPLTEPTAERVDPFPQ